MASTGRGDAIEGQGVKMMIGRTRRAVDTLCPWEDRGAALPTDITGSLEQEPVSAARNVIKNHGDRIALPPGGPAWASPG